MATAVILGRRSLSRTQLVPPSSERNKRPSSVPNTTIDPWAARQPVSTLLSNQGNPSLYRTNAVSLSSNLR
jgi:hypothetical protein